MQFHFANRTAGITFGINTLEDILVKVSYICCKSIADKSIWELALTQPPASISANKGIVSSFWVNLSLTKSFTYETQSM